MPYRHKATGAVVEATFVENYREVANRGILAGNWMVSVTGGFEVLTGPEFWSSYEAIDGPRPSPSFDTVPGPLPEPEPEPVGGAPETKTPYEDWTLAEIKAEVRQRGLRPKARNRDALVAALYESDN